MFSWLRFFLKFEAEGQEFAKMLRSLEQFVQTVKGHVGKVRKAFFTMATLLMPLLENVISRR